MLHWSSVAIVDRPLALVAGVSPLAADPVGVAHTNGLTCSPEITGPPILWLVITRYEPWPAPRSADRMFGPSAIPVTWRLIRPLPRTTNWLDTSLSPSVTWSCC